VDAEHAPVNGKSTTSSTTNGSGPAAQPPLVTLNSAVRRRRADRAFYIRLAGAIRQNEPALQRLSR
jgi:hypothetical protein